MSSSKNHLKIGLAQISSVYLDKAANLEKVSRYAREAAEKGCQLLAFGEALVPAYPFWIECTGGAKFNSDIQKDSFAHYLSEGVVIEEGDLDQVCQLAARYKMAIYLGIIEKPASRGYHTLYCSLVCIDSKGQIASS